ncbi:ribonuclease Z [Hoyosella rhizosphaerae]|uniref:ribonuclease Z n=1 Tax=Hoyosella rhizosphaerae TaxID=1755582 RepID=UPI0027DE9851|nr:ribonuclease Z [Hoyosella rhizosphaerae]
MLGTASAVPTRQRNHNGYFLRWGDKGVLCDPGEGTQRQMSHAGIAAHDITTVCITHFHGDHCLGLPGVIQRIARDGVPHDVTVAFPNAGRAYFDRLRWASEFQPTDVIRPHPVAGSTPEPFGMPSITALPLRHSVPVYGYRIEDPSHVRVRGDELAAAGVRGPAVGQLKSTGSYVTDDGRTFLLDDFSDTVQGMSVAFVMDTGVCDNAVELACGVDLLVIESTYLESEREYAQRYRHLTAMQAGRIAAQAGAKKLLLTHFSERYTIDDGALFAREAATVFSGPIVVAHDLLRISLR